MKSNFPKGVATGRQVQEIFEYAEANNFALPAVNVIEAVPLTRYVETAAELNSPVIHSSLTESTVQCRKRLKQ